MSSTSKFLSERWPQDEQGAMWWDVVGFELERLKLRPQPRPQSQRITPFS